MRVDCPQESQLGEETTTIERLSIDGLLEEIRKWKYNASSGNDGSTTDKIIKALNKAEDEISNEAPKRGELRTQMQPIEPEKRNKVKKLKERSMVPANQKRAFRYWIYVDRKQTCSRPSCDGWSPSPDQNYSVWESLRARTTGIHLWKSD
jgi:hypothetical protein